MKHLVLAITSGEPAGIGPDICLDIPTFDLDVRCVVLADINMMRERAQMLGKEVEVIEYDASNQRPVNHAIEVLHVPLPEACVAGTLNVNNAEYVIALLDRAYQGIEAGEFAAMVTAPLHKGMINDAGRFFSGHTEYLADISATEQVVMMLAGGGLKVALVTTHLPLKDVAAQITPELLSSVVRILNHDLQTKFHLPKPRILVTGLNPHAGEGGHLGMEELDVIIPTLEALRTEGLDVKGPYPADTVFEPFILKHGDAVLAMYHDQGLPVLKFASFGNGVNITLGLPFVRTSVDHGTALDLAGTGQALSGSLKAAIESALLMSNISD
ncbi:4-hydroxythreonine-4-phosphate dehydrogenase PdxA [Vitreoscilla stercoraria]|uniref:4-hydroxythreonine-4-phosphate dehydrogenase n=1 Tax=Vitreoscilla stercoraria TaxID=61 RepID=A0ABY4E9S0_VITST|nr:4-hydroxythreonine-4-phosphate dehydrogenase PdxA [Vitreoscilla stercoraria]UOO92501.1 4-hydroxythreonine-4-phosphate dehydrogenase PdxA [Vitreoscilla stercoraria]